MAPEVTVQPTSTGGSDAKVEDKVEDIAAQVATSNQAANTSTMKTSEVPSITSPQEAPSDEHTSVPEGSQVPSQPKEEEVTQDAAEEVSEGCILFGVDVSHVGTEFPTSRHHIVTEFRRMVKKFQKMMYYVGDDSVQEIAENFKAGLNLMDKRMTKTRKEIS